MDRRINILKDEDIKDQFVCENVQTTTGMTSGISLVVGHGKEVDATEIIITREQLRALLHELGDYTIETLDANEIDSDTILLIRTTTELGHPGISMLLSKTKHAHPLIWILRPEEDIKLLREEEMNAHGWYRKG